MTKFQEAPFGALAIGGDNRPHVCEATEVREQEAVPVLEVAPLNARYQNGGPVQCNIVRVPGGKFAMRNFNKVPGTGLESRALWEQNNCHEDIRISVDPQSPVVIVPQGEVFGRFTRQNVD